MADTKIEWAEKVYNPVTGCTKISEGCKHCYAERMSKRLAGRFGYPAAPHNFDVTLHPDRLDEPLHWRKPRRIFVCSMSDLFHEDVPYAFISRIFRRMLTLKRHTFLLPTKRPHIMQEYLAQSVYGGKWHGYGYRLDYPSSNIIGMVTAENQKQADIRIPILLRTPFARYGVSLEPMLGCIRLDRQWIGPEERHEGSWLAKAHDVIPPFLDWIIAGGESGPGARPMHPDWARGIRDQCQAANVPFLFKQWGAWIPEDQDECPMVDPAEEYIKERRGLSTANYQMDLSGMLYVRRGKKANGRILDGKVWDEYPEMPR